MKLIQLQPIIKMNYRKTILLGVAFFGCSFQMLAQQQYTFSKTSSFWSTSNFPNVTDENDVATHVAVIDSLVATTVNFTGNHLRIQGVGASSSFTDNAAVLVYDTLGNFIFEKSNYFTGDGLITADQVLFDSNGNYYVAGSFASSTLSVGLDELTQSGTKAGYLIKFDVNGDYLWGQVFESDASVQITTISLDQGGSVVVGGQFSGSGLVIGSETLNSNGDFDGFISKIDSEGNATWSYQFGGNQVDEINDIYVTPEDSVLVAASFNSTSLTLNGQTESTTGGYEAVAMVFDKDGILRNYEVFNSTLNVNSSQIVGSGDTWYLAMKHRGLLYGNNPSNNHDDVQIAKYVDNVFERNQLIRSTDDEDVTDMRLLENGNVLIMGNTEGSGLQFDLVSYPGTSGQFDIFLFEMDPTSAIVRAFRKGQPFNNEFVNAFDFQDGGEFWVAGSYNTTTYILDADTLFNRDQSGSTSDAWLSRMSLNNLPQGVNITPGNIIDENLAGSSYIGTLAVSDPDPSDTHKLYLDPSLADNLFFKIIGDTALVTNSVFDFETKSSYSLEIKILDNKGGIEIVDFTILIANVNEPPTAILLSDSVVIEKDGKGALVSNLSSSDPDNHPDGFSYSLIDGDGDDDNLKFYISEDKLYLEEALDFEQQSSVTIRIQTDDQMGAIFSHAFSIKVLDNIISNELSTIESMLSEYGGIDRADHVILDDESNRYVSGMLAVDSTFVGGQYLSQGAFIASFTPTLALRWALNVNGTIDDIEIYQDTLYALSENVYRFSLNEGFAGDSIISTSSFEFMEIHQDTIYLADNRGVYLRSYDMSGSQLYEKFEFVSTTNVGAGFVVDDDHLYIAYEDNATSRTFTNSSNTIFKRSGVYNAFLLAFSHSGDFEWYDAIGITGGSSTPRTDSEFLFIGEDGAINFGGVNTGPDAFTYTITTNTGAFTTTDASFLIRYNPDGSQIGHTTFANSIIKDGDSDVSNNIYTYTSGAIGKLSSGGSTVWQQAFPGTFEDLALDGNIITAVGEFEGEVTFNGNTYDAVKNSDVILVNIDEFGNPQESLVIGNPGGVRQLSALGEPIGQKLRAIGWLEGEMIFGSDTLKSSDGADILVVDYSLDDEPLVQSAKVVVIDGMQNADAIATDDSGNSLVWDEGVYTDGDSYLVKIDNNADTLWTRDYGIARISDAVFSSNGDVYVSALYRMGSVTLDGETFTNGSSANNSLLIKLNADGNVQWVKDIVGSQWVNANEVVVTEDAVFVVGYFSGSLMINSDVISVASVGMDEVFILKLDIDGNSLFTKKYVKTDENYRFNDRLILEEDNLYLHNRNANTAQEEILRTDLFGLVDTTYIPPFDNFSHFSIEGSKIYLSKTSEGRNLILNLDFEELQRFPTEPNYYGSIQVREDTIYNLNSSILTESVIQSGPESFSLESASYEENYTGFISKIVPENPSDEGTYTPQNNSYSISNDSLFVNSEANFESISSIDLEIEYTDTFNQMVIRNFVLSIEDVNEAPTDIAFDNFGFAETDTVGTAVGVLSATDPDDGDETFTYALTDSTSLAHFYLDEDTVRLATELDFESFTISSNESSYFLRINVAATDDGGLSYETTNNGTFMTNVNELPSSLDTLISNEITSPVGNQTTSGSFGNVDPDFFSSYRSNAFFLLDSLEDNALFLMSGNQLLFKNDSSSNYEVDSIFHITVGVYDPVSSTQNDSVYIPTVVKLTNQNDLLTGLGLSADSVAENMPAGTAIGAVLWEDEDVDAGYDISVVQKNTHFFEVVNDTLYTLIPLDFETTQFIDTRLSFDDTVSTSNTRLLDVTIQVLDRNDPPRFSTVVNFQNSITDSFEENDTTSFLKIRKIDPDINDVVFLSLVEGEGDSLNYLFEVDTTSSNLSSDDAGLLRPREALNFEENEIVTARLRLSDLEGLSVDSVFSFTVEDRNDPVTNIRLTNYRVKEWTGTNETVASILYDDEDNPDRSTWGYGFAPFDGEFVDNDKFSLNIQTGEIQTTSEIDFEGGDTTYQIRVSVRDDFVNASGTNNGTQFTTSDLFTIEVVNVNEPPTNLQLDRSLLNQSWTEDLPVGTLLALVNVDDAEGRETVTLTTSFDGLEVRGDSLVIARPLDYERDGETVFFDLIATDTGGLSATRNLEFRIGDVNEFDVQITWQDTSLSENISGGTELARMSFFIDNNEQSESNFLLVNGEGDDHNSAFRVEAISNLESRLVVDSESSLNYEAIGDTIRVRIAATRVSDLEVTSFVLLNDINEAPLQIDLSTLEINENAPIGTIIGELSAFDEDVADSLFTYSVSEDIDFAIAEGRLVSNQIFDFEIVQALTATLSAADDEGLSISRVFTITIINDLSDDAEEVLGLDGQALQIFPNPVAKRLHLSELHLGSTFEILSISGKQLISGAYQGSMDVSSLNPGIYFIRVTGSDVTFQTKFIKE